MDDLRLRKLAGINTTLHEEVQNAMQELDLLEKMYQGKHGLNIDTDVMSVEDIQKRLDAVARAFKAINKLKVMMKDKDPDYAVDAWRRVTSNMNTITAAMKYKLKQMEAGEDEAVGM